MTFAIAASEEAKGNTTIQSKDIPTIFQLQEVEGGG